MKKKTPFKLFIFWTLACRYFIFQPKKNVYTTTWKNPCGNFFMALARPQPGKTGTQLGYRGRTKPYIYIIYISYILILLTNILNWIWFWDYTETKYELFKKLSTEFTIALLFIKNKSVKHAVQINQIQSLIYKFDLLTIVFIAYSSCFNYRAMPPDSTSALYFGHFN